MRRITARTDDPPVFWRCKKIIEVAIQLYILPEYGLQVLDFQIDLTRQMI
jgi:hypothetical protein